MPLQQFIRHGFKNLEQFNGIVTDMAKAVPRNIYVHNNPIVDFGLIPVGGDLPDTVWDKQYQAIVNTKDGRVSQVATTRYTILQSRDFYSAISDLLEQQGFKEVNGYVDEIRAGEIYNATMNFPGTTFDEPRGGDNIGIGARFTNSYSSTGAFGNAHYLRMSCTNGMTMKHAIHGMDFSRAHVAASEKDLLEVVTKKIEEFVDQMLKSEMQFKEIVEKAEGMTVKFQKPEELFAAMEEIFGSKVHAKAVTEEALKYAKPVPKRVNTQELTNWDIYNALTWHTSHDIMTPRKQDKLLLKAENNILTKKVVIPKTEVKV